ncbi:MAG TPA: fatty acid desaturase [Chloroflexia bacterium]|nr:fatty acid desaturase [Chloroflexia bacterium]
MIYEPQAGVQSRTNHQPALALQAVPELVNSPVRTDGTASPARRNTIPLDLTIISTPESRPNALTGSYKDLKALVVQDGLLNGRPVYYAIKFLYTLGGLALLVWAVLAIDWLPARIALVFACALAWAQVGFLGHDLGHRQVFGRAWVNDVWGLLTGNILLGMSIGWWRDKHNAHHANPNVADVDPDLDIPVLAFTETEAQTRRGLARKVLPFQAALFLPFVSLSSIDFQLSSIRFQFIGSSKSIGRRALELSLLLAHKVGYIGGLLLIFGLWGLAVGAAHQACLGILLGTAFAPNHKGMPMVDDSIKDDFLRKQVLTARNVRGPKLLTTFVDWWYGGLNYQIEHHLFPAMPRCNLGQARALTMQFCQHHGISYHETGVLKSYQEIIVHLNAVGASVRDVQPVAVVG